MKRIGTIILVVLSALVYASPAAADSIHLSVSPTSVYSTEPTVTYQVSGETEVGRGFAVRLMRVGWEGSNCGDAAHKEWHNLVEVEVGPYSDFPTGKFELNKSFSLEPEYDYEGLGTYVVCAVTVNSEAPAETSASFTVVTPPPVPVVASAPAPVAAPSPAPPTVAPVAPAKPPVVTPVVKRVSKLAKALKQCKKQYKHNKKKRAKCERVARKSHH